MITKIKSKIRNYLLRKLKGVDKHSVESFVRDFMQPNGKACLVVTESETVVFGGVFESEIADVGIVIAPWVDNVLIENCHFIGKKP